MPNYLIQIQNFYQIVVAYQQIAELQTEALANIATQEMSLDGGITMKHIAETALIETNSIAAAVAQEVHNAEV